MSEAVDRLIAYCRENNRVCPLPKALRGGAATARRRARGSRRCRWSVFSAAPAAASPEQIRLVLRIGRQHLAVGGNDVDRKKIVAGQAVNATKQSEAAPPRMGCHTDRRAASRRKCKSGVLECLVHRS